MNALAAAGKHSIVGLLLMLGLFVLPRPAAACSPNYHGLFEVDDEAKNVAATPHQVTLEKVSIKRGQDGVSAACDDLGRLRVLVTPVEPEVGYIFATTRGDGPQFFYLARHPENPPLRVADDGTTVFEWGDGLDDSQEPLDFYMTVTPVNRAGEMGPTSEELHITDPGSSGSVCSITNVTKPVAPGGTLLVLLVGLLGWRHARRR